MKFILLITGITAYKQLKPTHNMYLNSTTQNPNQHESGQSLIDALRSRALSFQHQVLIHTMTW